jgi:hypothetical protein
MRNADREHIRASAGKNMEAYFQRVIRFWQEIRSGPWIPWLPPGLSCSEARRMAARLRSGAIVPADPRISPLLLAYLLDMAAEKELILSAALSDARAHRGLSTSIDEKYAAERRRSLVRDFHRLKESPEAQDPDSRAAQRLRRLHRVRRQENGRSRRQHKPRSRRLKALVRNGRGR